MIHLKNAVRQPREERENENQKSERKESLRKKIQRGGGDIV
jgi:hypothetical protein